MIEQCKILVLLENRGEMSFTELHAALDLTKRQLKNALRQLMDQEQVDKAKGRKDITFYHYCGCRPEQPAASLEDLARASGKNRGRHGPRPLWQRVACGDRKVTLLRQMADTATTKERRMLLIGVLQDYGL